MERNRSATKAAMLLVRMFRIRFAAAIWPALVACSGGSDAQGARAGSAGGDNGAAAGSPTSTATGAGGGATSGGGADTGAAGVGGGGGGQYPVAPGVYATITATAMAGSYAMTANVDCYGDPGLYTMTGTADGDFIDVHTTDAPAAGKTLLSPHHFVALGINDPDGGYYPANADNPAIGSCTITVEQGWPHVLAKFGCGALVGWTSGVPFAVVNGVVVCP